MPEFKVGDLVWAKMKGYSPWPARIIEPTDDVKSKSKEPRYCVLFFGARQQTAFVAASDILTFEEGKEKCAQKKVTGMYKNAVNEMYFAALGNKSTEERSLVSPENKDVKRINNIKIESPRKVSTKIACDVTVNNSSVRKSPSKIQHSPKMNQKVGVNKEKKSPVKRPISTSIKKQFDSEQSKKRVKKVLNEPMFNVEDGLSHIVQSSTLLKTEENIDKIISSVSSCNTNHPKEESSCNTNHPKEESSSGSLEMSETTCALEPISLPLYDCEVNGNIMLSSTKIGFVGLGSMGSVILAHLIASKVKRHITVWNRTVSKCENFEEAGVIIANSPADVMANSDIVFSCVSDRSAVQDIIYRKDGILSALSLGKGYVEMTTIDPDFARSVCEDITLKNGRYLEVSMLGMKKHALNASLLLLAAGEKVLFQACRDCFQDIAEHVFFLGDAGGASKMNIIINMIKATCFASISEAMNLAERAGISQKDTIAILEQGQLNCPAIIGHGNAILDMLNDTGYDNMPVEHMQKFLRLALEIADQHAQPIPTVSAANDLYTLTRRRDMDRGTRSDITEIYKVLCGEQKDMYLNSID